MLVRFRFYNLRNHLEDAVTGEDTTLKSCFFECRPVIYFAVKVKIENNLKKRKFGKRESLRRVSSGNISCVQF